MSKIAEETGIGRATLYKYFPDIEAILIAWHERQVTGHLEHLAEVRDQAGEAGGRARHLPGVRNYLPAGTPPRPHHVRLPPSVGQAACAGAAGEG